MSHTRRQFLHASAAGLATAALDTGGLRRRLAAAAPAPRFALGFSQYGMLDRKTADAMKACADIGYRAFELAPQDGWPADPKALSAADRKELRSRYADLNLTLPSLLVNLPEPVPEAAHRANLDRIKAVGELGHDLSPASPPVILTNISGKPADWPKVRDHVADRFRAWADAGKAVKTVVAVKPHVKCALHSPDGGRWVMEQVNSPWLRLCYDFSHYRVQGLGLADTVKAVVPLSALVHLKDAAGTADKFEFLLPGDGDTDYREFGRLVAAAGYRGPMVVEVSRLVWSKPGYDPVAAAKRCYAKLAGPLGDPG